MDVFEGNIKNMNLGAITLLDILGWKGIWQRKSNAVEDLLHMLNGIDKKIEALLKKDKIKNHENTFKNLKIEVKSISDTIALVTYGDCNPCLEFHAIMSNLIITTSIRKGIPVRGATCYGYFTTQNNIMVGPAVDEVASWYEQADWIGVILTPSALFQIDMEKFTHKKRLKLYNAPIKQYGRFETYCCNWPYVWDFNKYDKSELLKLFLEMGPITPNIFQKFANTIDFYDKFLDLEKELTEQLTAATRAD
ncbi:MAG: hypothetical protein WBL93_14460 [Lutisporaceae bacterium]